MQDKYNFFQYEESEGIRDRAIIDYAEKEGNVPFYLFDMEKVVGNIKAIRTLFGEKVKIAYAMKANPWIASGASEKSNFVEVCSEGELELCKKYGINGNKIVVDGVFKNQKFFELALGLNVKRISIDSKQQLQDFLRISFDGERPELLLRISSGNQFGMEEDEMIECIRMCQEEAVKVIGIHYYPGTYRQETAQIQRDLHKLMQWVEFCEGIPGWKLQVVEFGAGIGVPYFENETKTEYIAAIDKTVAFAKKLSEDYEVVYEAGRIIAASAGIYVTRIFAEKKRNGKRLLFCMGGSNHLVYHGGIMGIRTPVVRVLYKLQTSGRGEACMLCGSLCSEGDILARDCFSIGNDIQVGDYLAFFNTGAYTDSANFILSMELPAVLLYNREDYGKKQAFSLIRNSQPTYEFLYGREGEDAFVL